jgi:HTH-type transcriptional regulator/antitoxin HigA
MEPRIIKTEEQYRRYLDEVAHLASIDPDAESDEGARLELLAKLVDDYEKERFPFGDPDPVDAIRFRMEQQGLRQKDIADLLGGKNRASEILSHKRPLTLQMIRALHERLSIPSELLIREPGASYGAAEDVRPTDVPLALLVKRGWVDATSTAEELLARFLAPAASPVLLKQVATFGASARTNPRHVWLWLARVREVAESRPSVQRRYHPETLNEELLKFIARLSWMEHGPRLAVEFLEERGVTVVVEPHLPSTHLDGAALLSRGGAPVIGLTIRHDRLDNFWFTLMHELVHAWKHLNRDGRSAIADENIERTGEREAVEDEANTLAAGIFIPPAVWKRSEVARRPTAESIAALARVLQISPAIIAGRVRHELGKFSVFTGMVGHRSVRKLFPEVVWS